MHTTNNTFILHKFFLALTFPIFNTHVKVLAPVSCINMKFAFVIRSYTMLNLNRHGQFDTLRILLSLITIVHFKYQTL